MTLLQKRLGLTLIEVIVAMGIMIIVTVMILGIYGNSFNAFRRGTSRLEAQQRTREVLRRVTPLIMSSKAPTPLGGC